MPAPTHVQIRDAIKAKITALATPAQIHTFEAYSAQLGDLRLLYVINGQLIGGHIRLVGTRRTAPHVGRWNIRHKWRLTFYMAIDQAAESELAFDTWIEAIAEAFRLDQTLGGLLFSTTPEDSAGTDGLQLDDSGPVMFAGVLAHSAKCTLHTTHLQGDPE